MAKQAIKVLFFGVFSKDSTNISQANAFEKNGCIVTRYDFRANPQLPADEGYDLIFYSKCNELGIDAVQKYKGIKCLWYMDPLNGNYGTPFLNKIDKVDFVCFALHDPYFKTNGTTYGQGTPCYLIEEGFDPDVDKIINDDYIFDVSFIGNLYDEKRKKYQKETGFSMIQCSRIAHPYKVAQSRINLNFTDGGTSDRAYKIMSSGGFLLSEAWPGCPFEDGKEFISFDGVADLNTKIQYYLSRFEERQEIADNGWRSVQKYGRDIWAKRILDIYKQCKS